MTFVRYIIQIYFSFLSKTVLTTTTTTATTTLTLLFILFYNRADLFYLKGGEEEMRIKNEMD